MNPIEAKVYSILNTIYLKVVLSKAKEQSFPTQRKAGEYFIREFKRLNEDTVIFKKAYKYFIKNFNPLSNPHFLTVISNFVSRYQDILSAGDELAGKDDYQRLIEALHRLRVENQFVVRLDCADEEEFSENEFENIKRFGLVTLPQSTKSDLKNGWLTTCSAITYLVYKRANVQSIIAKLQLSGLPVRLDGTVITEGIPGQIVFQSSKLPFHHPMNH